MLAYSIVCMLSFCFRFQLDAMMQLQEAVPCDTAQIEAVSKLAYNASPPPAVQCMDASATGLTSGLQQACIFLEIHYKWGLYVRHVNTFSERACAGA